MVLNNKNGQAMLVGLMMFVITFIAATMVLPALFDVVDISRADLGCELSNLTTGTAATCVWIDLSPAIFLAIVIASGASFITSRVTGG